MKNRKRQWLAACNQMLSGVLALLGFASYAGGETPEEYGAPYAGYRIRGKVRNGQWQPLKGMRVIVEENPPAAGGCCPGRKETVYTKDTGEYAFKDGYAWPETGYRIICEDPAGVYESDSVDIEMRPENGESGWYEGSGSKVVDFVLKKKEC